ncbi:hypothetical protein RHSIM_Rhsim04G0142800 [Rhododendron simsii]|uniref:Uncharacterized protein n=1 Tax=Rhododendron simsii TaxID=118357 RepID=A0A834LS78_RHOSS|nr:hypothetical protein RHSIM_Rhsim04G0142800 [Rhododendron simsii]
MSREDEVLEEARAVQKGRQQLQDTQNQMLAAFVSFTEVIVGVLPKSPGTCITEGVHRRANKSCITRPSKPKYLAYYCYHFNRTEVAGAVTRSEKIRDAFGSRLVTLSVVTAGIPIQITEIKRMQGFQRKEQNQMVAALASFTEVIAGVLPRSLGTCITEDVTSGYTAKPTKAVLPALPSPDI